MITLLPYLLNYAAWAWLHQYDWTQHAATWKII